MDGITHLEVSPGTITATPCQWCGNDAITFDTLALGNEGVAWAGTIRRCPTCEKRQP